LAILLFFEPEQPPARTKQRGKKRLVSVHSRLGVVASAIRWEIYLDLQLPAESCVGYALTEPSKVFPPITRKNGTNLEINWIIIKVII
jgi:hypothetical protein